MKLIKQVPMDGCLECQENDTEEDCTHEVPSRKYVVIVPGCCETSTKALFPKVVVDIDIDDSGEEDEEVTTPAWYIPTDSNPELDYVFDKRFFYPAPTHCPFCGTSLPEIVADPEPPSPIASHDDCGHCNCGWPRSYGMCACWPRSAAFTLKPKELKKT